MYPTSCSAVRTALLTLIVLSTACSDNDPSSSSDAGTIGGNDAGVDADAGAVTVVRHFDAPQDDLDSLIYAPEFEPDYNRLVPQPDVEVATKQQADDVDVYADRLEFPFSHTEVLDWEAGRLVVAAPSEGVGNNGMGFARRVTSVVQRQKIVVFTETAALEDIVQGDFQVTLDPADAVEMDLVKMELQWVADNLYQNSPDADLMPGTSLPDDYPLETQGLSFWDDVGDAFSDAADALAGVAVDIWLAITPATIGGSVDIGANLTKSEKAPLFPKVGTEYKYSKTILTKKGLAVQASIAGSAGYEVEAALIPGLQIGAQVAVPGHDADTKAWLNIDAYARAKLVLDLALTASIESADGKVGSQLQSDLNMGADFAQDILSAQKEAMMGDPSAKPAGGWKKTLKMTAPTIHLFFAGPVPVIVTKTTQLDLECGFQAKAGIKTHFEWEQAATFKFKVEYDAGTGRTTIVGPTFTPVSTHDFTITGGGSMSMTCGLIPRITGLIYDSIGMFTGVRASLVARGTYDSACMPKPEEWRPDGIVTAGLYANVGVQIGGRVQAPGASLAGKAGTGLGFDVGPLEPWSQEFPLVSDTWTFHGAGLGYCLPTCKNGTLDPDEADRDCGGDCATQCTVGKRCRKNSDCYLDTTCNGGICDGDHCADRVADFDETDIDCGGAECEGCAEGQHCDAPDDCLSGYCAAKWSPTPERCVSDHCVDGIIDADEGGVDCGGSTCAKCGLGAKVSSADDCESGIYNGVICVDSLCNDLIFSGDETDVDCGGGTCAARCGFLRDCEVSADCSNAAPFCDAARLVCIRADQSACGQDSDCNSGYCFENVCKAPSCGDQVIDGDETDVDCGGGACAACADGLACLLPSDCISGDCAGGTCAAAAICASSAECGVREACLADACVAGMKVFVTSDTSNANFGGLSAADTRCQDLATAANLAGTYKAWLSDDNTSAADRLLQAAIPYRLVDGSMVAANWTGLTSGSLVTAIGLDEAGQNVASSVWTGTGITGAASGPNCLGWMDQSENQGLLGDTTATDGTWTDQSLASCPASDVHLYCVEQ